MVTRASAPESVYVTRNIHMDRSMVPPETLFIIEMHYGVVYKGTVRRIAIVIDRELYYGVYQGYLYQE